MTLPQILLPIFCVAVLLSHPACDSEPRPRDPAAPGVVARVDDMEIRAIDLRARFHQGPIEVRLKAMSKGGRHYLLDLVIGERLLLREATKRGEKLHFSDVYERHERLMKRFLTAEFEDTVSPDDVPDEEVRELYEKSRDLLADPPRRKMRVIAAKTREQAQEIIANVTEAIARGDLPEIHRTTHPAEVGASGSQGGVFDRETAETYVGVEAAQAAFAIDEEGIGVFPEPVRYLDGWSTVVVLAEYPPSPPPPLEQAGPQIRQQLYDSLRNRRLDTFVSTFRKNHEVVIEPEGMDAVPWSPTMPEPVEPSGVIDVPTPPNEPEEPMVPVH